MTHEGNVLVIGAASLDVKGRSGVPLVKGTSNPGRIRHSTGGVARNVAENLARMGVGVTLLSAVGKDEAGDLILSHASEVGIDVSQVVVVEDGRTGAYVATLNPDGSLHVAVDDMAVMNAITPRYLYDRRRLLAEASMVIADANLSPETLEMLFKLTRRYQVRAAVDPTSSVLAPRVRPYLNRLYVATPNATEAEVLCDLHVRDNDQAMRAARYFVSQGISLAVITLGEMGLAYATSEESGHIPAIRADVVDHTGAGDALTAGVVFGILNEFDAVESVRLGLAAATLTLRCPETVCPALSLEHLYDQLGG